MLEVGNEGGNEGLIGGPNEQVINVDNDNDLRAQEETGVTRGGLKTLALEAFREVVEEVSAGLFEPIHGTIETHYAVVAADEATGLVDVDFFLRGQFGVDEGGSDVTLGGVQTELSSEDHHKANSAPLDNRGPSLEEVDTLSLAITADAKTGFEFLGKAVGVTFDFEDPF